MPKYYLAKTIPLRHGVRVYAGTQLELEALQTTLKKTPLWADTFRSESLLQPVELLSECTVEYPILRLDYTALNGEIYKLRASHATLHYLWLICGTHCFRMINPRLEQPLCDLVDSPHGWRSLPEAFLGLPGVLTREGSVLSSQIFFLDEVFASNQAVYADIQTPPPAINLQCTLKEYRIYQPGYLMPLLVNGFYTGDNNSFLPGRGIQRQQHARLSPKQLYFHRRLSPHRIPFRRHFPASSPNQCRRCCFLGFPLSMRR